MKVITVRHVDGDRFEISSRGHLIKVDQPMTEGGTDTAPTPTELFVASLASCISFYAHRYLTRHDLSSDGLCVSAAYTMASRPTRVEEIAVGIELADDLPDDRWEALLAVASHCTVHNTLNQPPVINIAFGSVAFDGPGDAAA